jgi:hypothetical protein
MITDGDNLVANPSEQALNRGAYNELKVKGVTPSNGRFRACFNKKDGDL